MHAGPTSIGRWPAWSWWLVLAITVLPFLGSGIQRTADGWYPEGDDATVTLLARDVATRHPPLVGMISPVAGRSLEDPEVHHPGPLEFYGLAPFVRLPGGPVPAATVAVVALNVLATALVGLALRRLGGNAAGIAGLLAVGIAAWGIGGDVPASVWNPDVVIFPFAALVATTAVVATGRHRWLPLQVGLASFVGTHLSFVGMAGMLGLWAAAVTGWDLVRQAPPPGRSRASSPRARSLWLSAAVVLLLWSPPLLQELFGDPGNLSQIVRSVTASDGEPAGWAGVAELGRVAGLPLFGGGPPGDLVVVVRPPSFVAAVRFLAPLLAAVAIVVVSRRRGDGVARRIAGTVVVAVIAGAINASSMPLADGILYRYYGRWMWPLGALTWLLLGVAAIRVARGRARAASGESPAPAAVPAWRAPAAGRVATGLAVGLAAVVALLPRPGTWEPWEAQRRAAGVLADPTADAVRSTGAGHAVIRFRGGSAFLSTGPAIALAVEGVGVPTTMDAGMPLNVLPWGDRRAPDRTPPGALEVWVVSGSDPADLPPTARLTAEAELLDDDDLRALDEATRQWRERLGRSGVAVGPRRSDDAATDDLVRAAVADPIAAFEGGRLGELAARGLVRLPSGSVDDLYTLDRLRFLANEKTVRTYVVDPA